MSVNLYYYLRPAAAFVRGSLQEGGPLFEAPFESLGTDDQEALFELGRKEELKMHRFKRTMGLPRVSKVIGTLKGFGPESLLDIGTGRGVFLWPLLDAFPWLPVHCTDLLDYRVEGLQRVIEGGMPNLSVSQTDATALPFEADSFDFVTFLETLEHIPETQKAIHEVCRVAKRAVILSVPSKEDENPEHIHLFTQEDFKTLFAREGVTQVKFEWVLNHMIVVALLPTS